MIKTLRFIFALLLCYSANSQSTPPGIPSYHYYICENNSDGFATFDLTSKIPTIIGNLSPSEYGVEFSYNNLVITEPTAYNNLVNAQQLWARVFKIETNANVSSRSGYLFLHAESNPIANSVSGITGYADEIPAKLQSQIPLIIGTQQNVTVTFFNSESDALNITDVINPLCNYTINSTIIWAKITVNTSKCFALTSFPIQILSGENPAPETLTFPDANFKAKLLESGTTQNIAQNICGDQIKIDTNNDGEIQQHEADLVSVLNVSNASITSLEGVKFFKNLHRLTFSNNLVTELDVAGMEKLTSLFCINNLLTELDLSQTRVTQLYCTNNNLTFINLKNGYAHTHLEGAGLASNPDLVYICADANEITTLITWLAGNQNVQINTYCSNIPGGTFNTISGNLRLDPDNNGCDASDLAITSAKVTITNGTVTSSTFTDNDGNYKFYVQSGTFTVTATQLPYFSVTPVNSSITFSDNNSNNATADFCIGYSGTNPDAEVTIIPVTNAQPGFNATYKIIYKNIGDVVLSGSVNLMFPDTVFDFVSAIPATSSQSSNNLNWTFTNLLPLQVKTIMVTLNLNGPMEVPPVNINDVLNFTATVQTSANDSNPTDNVYQLSQNVIGAYDPNDKVCVQGAIVSPSKIGSYLDYVINFENTGNAPATFVVVKDVINAAKYDLQSLQLLDSSHPMTTRITQNVIEFTFSDINLQPNEQGFVAFKIRSKNTLTTGDTVSNNANIYFDYNFPIETNLASTIFQTLSTAEFTKDDSITIYPNPAKDFLTVKSSGQVKICSLFDIQGRLILESKSKTMNISGCKPGVYLLKVTTDSGSATQKIIIN